MAVKRYDCRAAGKGLGNEQKAWKALEVKCSAWSSTTRQELHDSLNNTWLQRGQNSDEFLYHMETAWNRLYEMGSRSPTATLSI